MGETEPLVNRDELLDAMRDAAYEEADLTLSGEGRDLLRMLSTANRHTGMGTVEAYKQSTAFIGLPPDDQQRIKIYVARVTLVEEFRSYEAHED